VVAPLENMWSKQSFYVNQISLPWSRPEMLKGSWDTLYKRAFQQTQLSLIAREPPAASGKGL
jgi:hypothetical protein